MSDFNISSWKKNQYLAEAGLGSSQAQTLANLINDAIMQVDESLSYRDFAVAVAIILKEEYGTHNFGKFMDVLHAELGIEESINEGFLPSQGIVTIDGKKNVYTSSYQGKTDNLEDFLKAIDRIPNTVDSVKIDDQKFQASDKEGIKSKVKELTTDDTDEFIIASYYGLYKQDGDLDHPIYIDLRTPGKRQFGKDMAAGKYGSLD